MLILGDGDRGWGRGMGRQDAKGTGKRYVRYL